MTVAGWGRQTDRVTRGVVAITAAALVARLVLLGDRVQHFDEGRVAWWTLEFMRTGTFEYQFIIHGPFLQHVNTWVYSVIGPTDFASRLVVALVGGLLPLGAVLFRAHLRDVEVLGAAGFLAFNPVLLYYSRFSRSSVLVAAFMFVAFGFLVRFADTRLPRYLYGAALAAALGFTAKENAVIYLVSWLGAGTLVVALSLYARPNGRTGADRVRAALAARSSPKPRVLARWAGHLAVAIAAFLVVIVFFYAPRGGSADLYRALGAPGQLPGVIDSMVASIESGYQYWFGHASQPGCHQDNLIDAYACFLGRSLLVLGGYAGPLVGLAIVGTVVEHFAAKEPRWLVLFASYWGFVSVFGYPLGTDVFGPWIMVNALVPLALPAGIGLALLWRKGTEWYRADDRVSAGLVAVVLLVAGGQLVGAGVTGVYLEPTAEDNELVQFAQPSQSWRPTLEAMDRISQANAGVDVLVYGEHFVDGATEAERTPACVKWFAALPLPWYIDRARMNVACATNPGDLDSGSAPPIVIAHASERDVLADRLGDEYAVRTHYLRTVGDETVVFVRQ